MCAMVLNIYMMNSVYTYLHRINISPFMHASTRGGYFDRADVKINFTFNIEQYEFVPTHFEECM